MKFSLLILFSYVLSPSLGSLRAYITRFERRVRNLQEQDNVNTSVPEQKPIFKRRIRGEKRTDVSTMSRNITMVLENLLKNYQNSQLPSHGGRGPTVIKTNMLIRSMGPVSELDMDYSMDCYFRQYWRDSRLSFMGPIKSLSLSIKMLERIWRPDTYFYNGKQSYVHTITVPNKLLRISQEGDILYSMRLTIKAKCPMELRNFPMDSQSCPLVLGSYAYTDKNLVYQWQSGDSVSFVPGMTLSQFDLMSSPLRNLTFHRREGHFSVLQVNFNLQRNTGYFVIQIYVPCVLIVVLSWVSFWIHREATSDRVGLGITTVLTLSTISLDSRNDLPKVHYATALDWFLLMSFFYCIATLLEFAGVHYFTKVGYGEIPIDEDEWEETGEVEELLGITAQELLESSSRSQRRRSSLICPIYNDHKTFGSQRQRCNSSLRDLPQQNKEDEENIAKPMTSSGITEVSSSTDTFKSKLNEKERIKPKVSDYERRQKSLELRKTVERHTQTDKKIPKWKQLLYCLMGDDNFRKQRQRQAAMALDGKRHVNSVSNIDQAARILFPLSFTSLNVFYWVFYLYSDYPKTNV